ncbi:MAG: hypothetical protein ACRDIV_02145 [Ktedonobacteraceae bacterium]
MDGQLLLMCVVIVRGVGVGDAIAALVGDAKDSGVAGPLFVGVTKGLLHAHSNTHRMALHNASIPAGFTRFSLF